MKTVRTAKIYVTDVSDYVYCPRLFFMKKTMDIPRMETLAMHKGTIEHEIRRSAVKSIKAEYEACKDPYALKTIDYQSCIKGAIFSWITCLPRKILDLTVPIGHPVTPEISS